MVLENHVKLCMTDLNFPEKIFMPRKSEAWAKNRPRTGFFEVIEKFGH